MQKLHDPSRLAEQERHEDEMLRRFQAENQQLKKERDDLAKLKIAPVQDLAIR